MGQGAPSPFRNQKPSLFCQLAKYIDFVFFKSSSGLLFEHSGSATELGSFNDSLYSVNAIEIFNLKINWTKLP